MIIANGLEDFIEGETPIPTKFLDDTQLQINPLFIQWEQMNRLVMSWTYSSLTPTMVGRTVEYKTAQEIWGALNNVYQSPSIATMLGLNSQLQKIKKEGITIYEYLAHIKEVFDKYSAMGEPLFHRDKLMYTLNGLTEEYDGFVTSIYNRSDKSSLEEVHSLLYTYEYWLEQRNTAQQLHFP